MGGFLIFQNQKDEFKSKTYPSSFNENSKDIFLVGLGEFQNEDLKKSKEILKEVFQIESQISPSKKTKNSLYHSSSDTLVSERVLSELKINDRNIIYITNEPLVSNSNQKVRGMTHLGGSVVVVRGGEHLRETLIHEMGHTFGLTHCDDETCIMAINNDETDSGDFCKKCRKTLNEVRNEHGRK